MILTIRNMKILHCYSLFSTPSGLEDVSKYPALFASLLASGAWSLEDLKKLAGINFLRVFREVEKVRLSKSFSTKWNYSISMQDNKLFGRKLGAKSFPLNLCNWNIIKMSIEKYSPLQFSHRIKMISLFIWKKIIRKSR